ncbi:MAG: enolase C-terminal domain-like protein, partial [Candidatus Latescibacteria bacterium]|nr:enolase C-terminal domain-like protein [Candidatus Latescibacterota bacterium]
MKITSVDIWTVVVPALPGRVNSPEWVPETGWDQVTKHMLRLNTDTEFYGIGETSRGVSIEDVRKGASLLLGKNPEYVTLQNIYEHRSDGTEERLEVGQGPAYAAFEIAVFDLIGRIREMPVHALLGGAVKDRVRVDYWMGSQTPEDGKKTVERALKAGFKGIKIKCKIEEPMFERLKAICDVAGPDFKVTVDPNERFRTAAQTIELAHQLEPLGNVEVFEDPIPKSDLEGYIQIHEAINQPVAMHLGNGAGIIRAVKAGVVDCLNLGGGLFGFLRNASVAAAAGLHCWHGSGVDLGILDTSYIHTISAAPNCTMASDIVGSWVREHNLIQDPIPFEDGFT